MKILCGIDFSERTHADIEVAAGLVRRSGGTLLLCHVFSPPLPTAAVLEATTALELDRTLRAGIEESLERLARPLREQGLSVETLAVDGPIATTLAEVAKEKEAEVVVVGSRGGRGTTRFFLGSIADRLVEQVERPVLVLRGRHEGFAAWAAGERALRVVVGVDLSRASTTALRWLHTLRELGPCDLTLVHLYWPPVEYARLGLRGRRSFIDTDPEISQIVARELERRLGELPGEGTVEVHVTPSLGSVSAPLNHWSRRSQADLMVVGHHHRGFLERLWAGSVAHRMLSHAEVPVACICEPPERAVVPERMPRFNRVVAALEVDDAASLVLAHALAITEACGEVEICHVVPGPVLAPGESALSEEERHLLRDRFEALLPTDAEELVQSVQLQIVEGGEPGQELVAFTERVGADVIVIGSRGRADRRHPLGSVSEWVLHHNERPTLVVRTYPD